MLGVLFWNLRRRPLEQAVATLAHAHGAEVVVLAEAKGREYLIQRALPNATRADVGPRYFLVATPPTRLAVYCRLPRHCVQPVAQTGGLSICRIIPSVGRDILLVGAHLASKAWRTSEDQAFACPVRAAIEREEQRAGHQRTVIVGDLNMDPFEPGLVGAGGLHAMSTRHVAARGSRTVDGRDYPMFYNPMWSLLGDRADGPPGTYYYAAGGHVRYFWHMFDQVLVRP
jgi:hypothetical protein